MHFRKADDLEVISGGFAEPMIWCLAWIHADAAGCIDRSGESKSEYRLPLCSVVAVSFLWERREPRCLRLLQASGAKLGATKKR
jgi:hypothetical protein